MTTWKEKMAADARHIRIPPSMAEMIGEPERTTRGPLMATETEVREHEGQVSALIARSIEDLERRLLELEEQHIETAALAQRASAANHRVNEAKGAVAAALQALRRGSNGTS